MKSRVVLLIVAALFATFAHATNDEGCHGNCQTTTPSSASSDADATSIANASNRTDVRTDVDVKTTSIGVGIGEGGNASSKSYSEGGNAKSSANQDQAQLQGQLQGQSQTSKSSSNQSQSANNDGNSQDVTVNNVDNSRDHKPAANTSATVIGNTTASCRAFIGISGGVVSGGGGIGFPITDGDCKFMTLAQGAFAQNNPQLGWNLYCRAPTVTKEIGYDACMKSSGWEVPPAN